MRKNNGRNEAKQKREKKIFMNATSPYRIFSRAFCNFVFPPDKERPFPKRGDETDLQEDLGEDLLDNANLLNN